VYEFLGEDWSLLLTDVTEGKLGNAERIAFMFDTRRVQLSGLACEIVIPPEHLARSEATALQRQFARTPYAVGFRVSGHTITLVSLHAIWGDSPDERVKELATIAEWLARWSCDKNAWDHNLITLGDFNISTGLYIPSDLRGAPRSVFTAFSGRSAAYDQIAWFEDGKRARPLDLEYAGRKTFDFVSSACACVP
jgi:hypothetical protein